MFPPPPGILSEVALLNSIAGCRFHKKVFVEVGSEERQPWRETVEEFGTPLPDICDHINTHFDVEGLCKGLPSRVQKVIDAGGDRVKK